FCEKSEKSKAVRNRVIQARQRQSDRFSVNQGIYCNAQMGDKNVRDICQISSSGKQLLKIAMERLGLSARAYNRILKVARTIADLDSSENIDTEHLAEAIQYRSLDRENWIS